jgi:hypothetical protein
MLSRTALVAALSVAPALADTAIPGYGGPGNLLNPKGLLMDLPLDTNGLSQLDEITRTPTGLLYPLPYLYPPMTQSKSDPDWWSMGWIQGGIAGTFGADPRSASFNRYTDWNDGLMLSSFGFLAENRKSAFFVSEVSEDAGRADQYHQIKAGRYGEFDITAFYDSIPHVYSTEARSIWNGAGTDLLTLRGGLVPGGSTPAEVALVAAGVAPTELSITREKAGLSFRYTPWKTLETVVAISNEERSGTQPISATFGYPFENGATQIIQPIHYRTLDVTTAVRYKTDDLQANLTWSGSFFRNSLSELTWENPGLAGVRAGSFIPVEGRLSLPPSNNYNTLKGDLTALISPDVRLSSSLSYSMMRQDETLLPPTISAGIIPGSGGPIDLSNWNTTAALSQKHANAAIDVFNAFAQLQYTASSSLVFDVELRDRNEMNRTNYVAFNPLTGEYGYIAIDGGLAPFIPALSGVYQPNAPGSVVQIRNMPFANDNFEVSGRASYRVSNHVKLDVTYTHNTIEHSVREVPNADDNRVRVQLATNGLSWGTVRVSYEFGSLSGSDYMYNPYTPYYSQSLPGYIPKTPDGDIPFTLSDLRKFDVGDRTEHILHAQANYIVSPRTDLQLTGDYKVDDYDALYGLRTQSSFDINTDVNYQMSLSATLTGFFTMQVSHRSIASINPVGLPGSAAAGGPDYPLANAWSEALGTHNYAAGFTAHKAWDRISLDANYIFTRGDSAIGYAYASTGAFFNLLTAAQAGNAFPDITFDSHALQASARWQATNALSCRLLYRVDFQNLDDFHYNGLVAGVIRNNTYLGVIPENFTVQTAGLFMQYTW